eukprot:m.56135 g.56135  ORF g.56135 m.56135 type:complete len:750 (-) comp15567_c0_seq1:261-2510(-)
MDSQPEAVPDQRVEASARLWNLLDCFQGPATLYKWLAIRHSVSPLFLNRTLKYVKNGKRRRLVSTRETCRDSFYLSKLLSPGDSKNDLRAAQLITITVHTLNLSQALPCRSESRRWMVTVHTADGGDTLCAANEVSHATLQESRSPRKSHVSADKDICILRLSNELLLPHGTFFLAVQEVNDKHSTKQSSNKKNDAAKPHVCLKSGTLSLRQLCHDEPRLDVARHDSDATECSTSIYLWPVDQHGISDAMCSVDVSIVATPTTPSATGAVESHRSSRCALHNGTADEKGQAHLIRLLTEVRSKGSARTHTPSPRPVPQSSNPAASKHPHVDSSNEGRSTASATNTPNTRAPPPDGPPHRLAGAVACGNSDGGARGESTATAAALAAGPDGRFACPECPRTFKSYFAVCAHAKVHTNLHGRCRAVLGSGSTVDAPTAVAIGGSVGDVAAVASGSAERWCEPTSCGCAVDADTVPVQFELRVESDGEECRWRPTQSVDGRCLWCKQKCSGIRALLAHLRCCHPRFATTHSRSGAQHVVTVSLHEERCLRASASDAAPSSQRRAPLPLHDEFLGVHGRQYKHHERFSAKPGGDNFEERPSLRSIDTRRLRPSVRQYYTSVGNNRDAPDGPDSEDETDASWVRHIHGERINEFTDVNDAEKFVMKLWSSYMLDHQVLADSHVFALCKAFLHDNAEQLRHYRNNVVLHLGTLYEFGILDRTATHDLVQHANSLLQCDTTSSVHHHRARKRKCES